MFSEFIKFLKSKKFLDIFCYIFFGIYIFFAISFVGADYSKNKNIELIFKNMQDNAASVNKQIEEQRILTNVSTDEPNFEQMFFNGKDAIISSYNRFYNADSFYMAGKGNLVINVDASIASVVINVGMNVEYARINKNKVYENTGNILKSASMLEGTIRPNVNKGTRGLREFDSITHYKSTHLKSDGTYSFNGLSPSSEPYVFLADSLFIINEETIKDVSYFNVKNTRKGPNYYVQLSLDTKTALNAFSEYMMISSDALEPVPFTKFILTACIDSNGLPTSINVDANCIIHMDMMGGIYANTTINLNLAISGINEKIDIDTGNF